MTGLLYDPLAYDTDEGLTPWLASSWTISEDDAPTARLTLRSEAVWHDGEPLSASDVVFTYDLLANSTLDAEGESVPSPRFRGRSSLVDEVTAVDESTITVQFVDADPSVAVRAFTVPVLPEHIWADRTSEASLGGIDIGPVTEALVTNNIPPIGSGPLRYDRHTSGERLVFERFDAHFSNHDEDTTGEPAVGDLPFDRFELDIVGSDTTAVEMVAQDEADVTGTAVGADTVPRIGRSEETSLIVSQSDRPYVLGYNTRRQHLANPRFRNTLARLIDDAYLSSELLDGYGRPAVTPLWDTKWVPNSLEWTDQNPVTPFMGENGTLEAAAARDAFREAGYQYDDGVLVEGST